MAGGRWRRRTRWDGRCERAGRRHVESRRQRVLERLRRLVPVIGIAGEAARQDVLEGARHLRPSRTDRLGSTREARHRGRHVGVASEGRLPGQHLVEDEAEGVDVGATVDGVAVHLLGSEVAGGPDHGAGASQIVATGRLGDSEVGDLHPSVRLHEHVRRFDVAMHEPLTVRVLERVGHLRGDVDRLVHGQPVVVVHQTPQGPSFDELHDDVRGAVVVTGVVRRHDPGMRELRGGDRFVAKAHAQRVVDGELGQEQLDRDAS